RLGVAHDYRRFKKKGGDACAIVHMMGSLFSMYRGYAAAGNAEHIVASKIEHCIKILFTLYRYNARRSGDLQCKAREVYADMLCVYAEINEHIRPDLLLNPHAEIRWRDAALQYCTEMMDIWKALHGRHLDVFEQPEGSPSQPSTSGLGSAGAGIGGSQASYTLPHDPRHIPDSDVQPSTSAEASSALQEAQVASHRSRTPSNDDLEPSSKRSRSA
ncbi:HGE-14 family type IV secretion system effector, partial [Anaplasma phagocytophilum]|uniref:HGE-14 family type IV secretion system effector n=1 Tax=Anaplasma phagocytophilum TaxID=948 RepID=UPI000B25E83A